MQAKVDPTAKIYPNVKIDEGTSVGEFSIIGKPYRPVHGMPYISKNLTKIGSNCFIGSFVTIGQGTEIGNNTIIEDYTRIELDVKVGSNCHLLYGAQLCNESRIGNNCIIGGFVCERAVIGSNSRIFGQLVHKQLDPSTNWDDTTEPPPLLEKNVFVGFGAKIIGGVEIGEHVYICSGAIVTKNIPKFHIVYGVNQIVYYQKWQGLLSESHFFTEGVNYE